MRDEKEQPAGKPLPPGLYIIATPIGNIGDMTYRAAETLGKLDALACEDTRETGKLLAHYGITAAKKISYHDHNADNARPEIIRLIQNGASIGLVSDAGMPLISDPGYKLVRDCVDAGVDVTCLPGASASLTALALAGLPTDRFFFAGFLPQKTSARKKDLENLKNIPATLVFYEAAPRLADSLADMHEILGDRPAAVLRELTKKFEEARRDTLSVLAAHYVDAGAPKGEIVIVVGAPDGKTENISEEDLSAMLSDLMDAGKSLKDAVAKTVTKTGSPKGDVYALALKIKDSK